MEKVPMTADGYAALDAEVKKLKGPERQRIIKAIAEARAHGDLSENAEYHAAKEQQSHNEGRVMELEDVLNRADVIDVGALNGARVKFGATVDLVDEDTEAEVTYQIVGEYEANVEEGKISIASPIARALISKESATAWRSTHRAAANPTKFLTLNLFDQIHRHAGQFF